MGSFGLELAGISLAVVGWLLSVVSCALPMWRVSAFIGSNIVTAQVYWEGLWMSCVFQSTGQMQCKVYDSMLALPQDLQAARALTVITIILGVVALLVSMVGAKCTNCIEEEAYNYGSILHSPKKINQTAYVIITRSRSRNYDILFHNYKKRCHNYEILISIL
uniref:Claudin n=1 Tax=Fundulus heteroclitus TaxID=8078 RepID=A0A3Q2QBT8_FUNHE